MLNHSTWGHMSKPREAQVVFRFVSPTSHSALGPSPVVSGAHPGLQASVCRQLCCLKEKHLAVSLLSKACKSWLTQFKIWALIAWTFSKPSQAFCSFSSYSIKSAHLYPVLVTCIPNFACQSNIFLLASAFIAFICGMLGRGWECWERRKKMSKILLIMIMFRWNMGLTINKITKQFAGSPDHSG